MKRLFGRKKKKVKNDDDIVYRPPSVDGPASHVASAGVGTGGQRQPSPAHAAADTALDSYYASDRSSSYGHQSQVSSAIPSQPIIDEQPSPMSDAGASTNTDVTSGYRHALAAYAETIHPALSNEDGMGGGGGTLRSRSGRVRGSAGLKHKGSLVPVFEESQPLPSGVGSVVDGGANSSVAGGPTSSAGGVLGAALLSPASSAITSTPVRQERIDSYERLMRGGLTKVAQENQNNEKEEGAWTPIPEEPRDNNIATDVESGEGNIRTQKSNSSVSFQTSESQEDPQPQHMGEQSHMQKSNIQTDHQHQHATNPTTQMNQTIMTPKIMHNNRQRRPKGQLDPTQLLSPQSMMSSHSYRISPSSTDVMCSSATANKEGGHHNHHDLILQPDAIYEEHYGDAYVDGLIKYLYPAGYQSMRPRSGPWKLSIFIFALFLWLSVFIVGHCYDRGQREYNYYFDNGYDDAYLQEVDDDQLVMETRWCGSKPLYFMWLMSVWITVLSMSYCSIIGYVKVRDIAVANGRSQPSGMMGEVNQHGRSDFYVMVDNVSSSNVREMGSNDNDETKTTSSSGYSSYQDGGSSRRYRPSIYQSDGTPQFWGGHIYRPTQAAVAMTNRP